MKFVFEVEMLNPDDRIDVEIDADGPLARDAFFKKFLTDKDERYFIDNKTGITYNKDHIYRFKLKGEENV